QTLGLNRADTARCTCAETVRPAGQAEEISRASLPCLHSPRPPRALRGVPSVPGSFSRRRGSLARRRPHREIPERKLSSCPTLRQRLGSSRSPWIGTVAPTPKCICSSLTTHLPESRSL